MIFSPFVSQPCHSDRRENLLVAGTAVLQATADSSTATPFRNDKNCNELLRNLSVADVTTGCAKVFARSSCYPAWLSFRPEGGICSWLALWRCGRQQIPQRLRRFGMTRRDFHNFAVVHDRLCKT
jgi:hypothetical protein